MTWVFSKSLPHSPCFLARLERREKQIYREENRKERVRKNICSYFLQEPDRDVTMCRITGNTAAGTKADLISWGTSFKLRPVIAMNVD